MRNGTWRKTVGLAVWLLWATCFVSAQERLPVPLGTRPNAPLPPATPIPATEPAPVVVENQCPLPEANRDWMSGQFFVSAEWLLLQPRRRAQDFAVMSAVNNGTPQGSVESVNWEANSGYRIGGGYRLPDSGWEIGAYYTYFHAANNRAINAPPDGALYATMTHPGFVDQVSSAVGTGNLNYNVVDVDLGRRFRVNDSLGLWLFGGGRFASIDQQMSAFYDGISANQARVSSPIKFNGAGLRVGGEGQWFMGRGFGLYANGAASLMTGDFRTSVSETNNNGATVITNVSDRFRKVVPVTELGLGVSWQNSWVRARVGYEIINWFGLVDSPDFVHDFTNKYSRRVSDLSLDGLAAQLEFAF